MIDVLLQWSLSVSSIVMLWLMGDGKKSGPVVGLLAQILWVWYVCRTDQWGLMPGVAMFTIVNARNCWKMWHMDAKGRS
jgi:hypothetical protein